MLISTIAVAIWLMLPAYVANGSAALFGGKKPIDRGIFFGKHRLLGDGKTYEGLLRGFFCGFSIGIIQTRIGEWLGIKPSFGTFSFAIIPLSCLSLGAMLGDIMGSFVKRRIGLERGAMLPIIDQLDFVFGAWLLLFLFARNWFLEAFTVEILLAIVIITPFLHLSTNYIAFKMGKKKVPW
ncbi:MAG: CDP-2,3-bis-(O-geranylgeranyl)-sn-glycerol synthase [Candidatus Methanospirareceae archaeon]